ncbi:hypothetical protein [Jannaschia sp. W003]|uniref:hypothetical protein n=1 Tax=Jannaschia sp. W003 TaxID=2867012 RepID=UPI0021A5AB2C|nr:hypothetical protein [Jannaschia sp. W003]UWQ21206.1 hypothetical protein K3554_14715 [Jannaschia sp. W003]
MRIALVAASAALLLGACADTSILRTGGSAAPIRPVPEAAPAPATPAPPPASTSSVRNVPAAGTTVVAPPRAVTSTVGALDRVSDAEKAEARNEAATAPASALGAETVSLGDPADAGLWVKTGLVSSETSGTVTASSGEKIAVTLRPLGGAGGAQISLSALQGLGLPLAGLHPVTLARK